MAAVEESPSQPHTCPPSPGSSVSLMEIMEDTRLVLGAFLRQSLTVPSTQRPGRVGGAYRDHDKFSSNKKGSRKWARDSWDSLDEKISVAEEKKHGFKVLIKKRLRLRRSQSSHHRKETTKRDTDVNLPAGTSQLEVENGLAGLEVTRKKSSFGRTHPKGEKITPEVGAVSSEEDEMTEKKDKKKKSKKLGTFSSLLRRLRNKESDQTPPQRPTSLFLREEQKPEVTRLSPTHPPQFYDEVAKTVNKIAQKTKPGKRSPINPLPATTEISEKDAVVRRLVHLLSMEGDAINNKIQSDPLLRSSLVSLSYPSFAKLLDTFASETEAPEPASVSPTLSRVAVTMEVSRRVVTATGAQRMKGYAERYMQNFAPWVQSQGGWDKIVLFEDGAECD